MKASKIESMTNFEFNVGFSLHREFDSVGFCVIQVTKRKKKKKKKLLGIVSSMRVKSDCEN